MTETARLVGWGKKAVTQLVVVAVVTALLLEGVVAWSFRYPRLSPLPGPVVRYLHVRFDRNVIQVMPECARYDKTLTYTLRPGQCTFASREFSNTYAINSLGVRDDEASLHAPQTVILGDSLAMGWGVEERESFPAVVERLTGRRTLNTGVASYGTVRELKMLERIDRSALRDVVIQYHENDALENSQLVDRPPFVTLNEAHYDRTVRDQKRLRVYFPGKYTFNIMVQLRSAIFGSRTPSQSAAFDVNDQARLFLAVLERSPVALSSLRVTVLSINSPFIAAAANAAAKSALPWIPRVHFLDVGTITTIKDAFYVLDDHPTAIGHEAIGHLLAPQLLSD